LWNPHKGTLIKSYKGHSYEILDVDVTTDNARIISVGEDRPTYIWDVVTGQIIRRLPGHQSRTNTVQFNKVENSVAVTGSYDKTVKIWDLKSNNINPIQVLEEAKDSISSLYVSGYEIITGSTDGNVRIYDIRAGQLHTDLLGQIITCVNLSHDGNCVLVSTLDSTIRLLDKSTGEHLNEYKGHVNTAYHVASNLMSTDGHVVSGSEDHTICFWDLVERNLIRTLRGHVATVCAIDCHPSQPYVISGSFDSTIRFWG